MRSWSAVSVVLMVLACIWQSPAEAATSQSAEAGVDQEGEVEPSMGEAEQPLRREGANDSGARAGADRGTGTSDSMTPPNSTLAAKAPWRGTRIGFRFIANPRSLDPSADLTYNPEVGFSADLRFRWWFLKQLYAQVDASLFKEFTRSDITNTADEPLLGDVSLKLAAPKVLTIPVVAIEVSPALTASFPTSRASQAKTMRLRLQAELSVSRAFDVLQGFNLSYRATGAHSFYEFTTAGLNTPRIRECVGGFAVCGAYLNTGVRNVQWRVTQGLGLSAQLLEWLGAYLQAAWVADRVFESSDEVTAEASFIPQEPALWRHFIVFGLGLSFKPAPWIELGVGASTQSPLLTPDSSIRSPFFNRYTTCFIELGLDLAHLVEGLSSGSTSPSGVLSP